MGTRNYSMNETEKLIEEYRQSLSSFASYRSNMADEETEHFEAFQNELHKQGLQIIDWDFSKVKQKDGSFKVKYASL